MSRRSLARCFDAFRLAAALALVSFAGASAQEPEEAADEELAEEENSPAPPPGVEEIVVVGEVRNAPSLKDTESVVLFDANDIQALGATDIADLSAYSPNVEIPTAGSTVPTFFIRGIGLADYNANSTGAIAVLRDGISINSAPIQLGLLYDIENVAILRGPQGISSFRNASAGAINVISKRPTGDYGASLISTFGRFNERDFQGHVEAPIVEDLLAGRLAFRFRERDGYVTNRCGTERPDGRPIIGNVTSRPDRNAFSVCRERIDGFLGNWGGVGEQSQLPFGLAKKLNDVGAWSARGSFLLTPDTPFVQSQVLLNLHGFHVDESGFFGTNYPVSQDTLGVPLSSNRGYVESSVELEVINPVREKFEAEINPDEIGIPRAERNRRRALVTDLTQNRVADILSKDLDPDPYTIDVNRTGRVLLDNVGGFLEIKADRGALNFVSRTGFEQWDRSYDRDNDYSPIVRNEDVGEDDAYQVTQDLALAGDFLDGDLTWNVGGMFLTEKLSADIDTFLIEFEADDNNPRFVRRNYTQETLGLAAYADFDWSISEDWSLEAGVRFNQEAKKFDFSLVNVIPASGPQEGSRSSRSPDATWRAPTGMIALTHHFDDQSSLFFKYTRGWKSGHFNGSVSTPGEVDQCRCAGPETIDSFEVGTKLNFLDDRLYLEAGAFYYKYKGYQIQVVAQNEAGLFSLEFRNAGGAKVLGAEAMARIFPIRDLVPDAVDEFNFSVSFGWLASQFTDFSDSFVVARATGPGSFEPFTVIQSYTGNRLPYSPPYTLSISTAWPFELGRFGTLTPRYDGAWSDETFFDQTEGRGLGNKDARQILPKYGTGQKPYWQHSVRVAYQTPGGMFEIAGWGRNLSNETYKINAFDVSRAINAVVYLLSEPRTYGGDITVRW